MLKKIINSKFVANHIDKTLKNPSYAAKFLLGAVIVKDAFEYSISAVQILNNKEMPKEKRKLIAALDASTGVLSCISQLALGFGILNDKVQKKIGDFLFKDLIKAGEHKTVQKSRVGLAVVSSLFLSTIIVKRILVPLFAAPIANYGTEFLSKHQKLKTKSVEI